MPKYVLETLKLGEKFNFSSNIDKKTVFNVLKSLDNQWNYDRENDLKIRNILLELLNNNISKNIITTSQEKRIKENIK